MLIFQSLSRLSNLEVVKVGPLVGDISSIEKSIYYDQMVHLKQIKELELRFTKSITFGNLDTFRNSLTSLVNLKKLDINLRGCTLSKQVFFIELSEALDELHQLESLEFDLGFLPIDDFDISSMIPPLSKLKNLKNLSIESDGTSINSLHNAVAENFKFLARFPSLEKAEICHWSYRVRTKDNDIQLLMSSKEELAKKEEKFFDFDDEDITGYIFICSLKEYVKLLSQCKKLSLNFGSLPIFDKKLNEFAEFIVYLKYLEDLYLGFGRRQGFSAVSFSNLIKSISEDLHLKSFGFRFYFGSFEDEDCLRIDKELSKLVSIESLTMELMRDHNNLDGVFYRCIPKLPKLKS